MAGHFKKNSEQGNFFIYSLFLSARHQRCKWGVVPTWAQKKWGKKLYKHTGSRTMMTEVYDGSPSRVDDKLALQHLNAHPQG